MFGKRGELSEGSSGVASWIIFVLAILAIFAVIIVNATDLGLPGFDLAGAPDGARFLVETLTNVVTPFTELIFTLVAPVGQDDNVQMIAFAIFLLLVLVGTKTLRIAFGDDRAGGRYAFIISLIVGLIAARSLTATVLQDTALGASPIAAASLLLGFIPIFALTKTLSRWGLSNLARMGVYTVVAFVYFLIFFKGFQAFWLGAVYGIGIAVIGAGEGIAKSLAAKKKKKDNTRTGRFIAWAGEVEETAKEMREGAGK